MFYSCALMCSMVDENTIIQHAANDAVRTFIVTSLLCFREILSQGLSDKL